MIVEIEVVVDDGDDHGLLVRVVTRKRHVVVQELAGSFNIAKAMRGGANARNRPYAGEGLNVGLHHATIQAVKFVTGPEMQVSFRFVEKLS